MRKLYLLASLGVLAVGLMGCNATWPSCFNRPGGFLRGGCLGRNRALTDAVDCCDPCESYYVPGATDIQWGAETTVQEMPVPGPAPQNSDN